MFRGVACDFLRTGVGCERKGLQGVWKDVHDRSDFFVEERLRVNEDILDSVIVDQIDKVFSNASKMLIRLRDELEMLIITRHRIARLEIVNRSALPEFDATHPRFKANTETLLEGKVYNRPVLKESNLKYPAFVERDGRAVMIAANASQGLEEVFVENLLNPDYAFLRWQRFTSNTGLTRQFPGAYDDGEYDNRLTAWYNMASQAPKRVVFLLDLSTNMQQGNRLEIAVATVDTLLRTLIPEDLVNIVFIDDETSIPRCFQQNQPSTLVPATEENIRMLRNFVAVASVGGSRNQLLSGMGKAELLLQATDEMVRDFERERGEGGEACGGYKCVPMSEFMIVVSDGDFDVGDRELGEFRDIAKGRPLLHVIGIAVGQQAGTERIRSMTCTMNGLFFHIEPIEGAEEGGAVVHPSHILNMMNEYFQLVAAPLARNHSTFSSDEEAQSLSLDVTWAMPRMEEDRSQITVTLALPCFGDSDSATPRLLGVVAVDLLFLRPGIDIGNSIFSFFQSIVKPPINADLEFAIVYKQGHRGVSMLDGNLIRKYGRSVEGLENYEPIEHYMFEDYVGEDFKRSSIMDEVLTSLEGSRQMTLRRRLDLSMSEWLLQPITYLEERATFAWRDVRGHPFVIIIRVHGWPNATDGRVRYSGIPGLLDRDAQCPDDTGTLRPCWSLPAFNVFEAFNVSANASGTATGAAPGSWLYIPPVAYQEIATYLQRDAPKLPPYCADGKPTYSYPDCDLTRLNNLMSEINTGKGGAGGVAGQGLIPQAFNEVLLSSVVDPLWNSTFADPAAARTVSRVYMSTGLGVFRTRGLAAYSPIGLPFLFSPNQHSWYLHALGKDSNLVLSPPSYSFFDGKAAKVLPISQELLYPFALREDHDVTPADTAGVMGAEIFYDTVHAQLYGENRMAGTTPNNSFSCGELASMGVIQCIVIDSAGVILMLPDFGLERRAGRTTWEEGPVFLGQVEPQLMEELVLKGFMVRTSIRDVTVTGANWGRLEGYTADDSTLPLVGDIHRKDIDGVFFVARIPRTNAYLIALDFYLKEAVSGTCGVLSAVCPTATYPLVTPLVPDICVEPFPSGTFRIAGASALLPGYSQERVIRSLRLTDNCTVSIPDWVWQLIIAGAGAILLVLLVLGVCALRYRKKREVWLDKRREANRSDDDHTTNRITHASELKECDGEASQQTFELQRSLRSTLRLFELSRALGEQAFDIDDYRNIIEEQTKLIFTLADRKALAQRHDDSRLESLGRWIGQMRTLAGNLQERLKAHEELRSHNQGGRRQGHALKTEVQNLDRQFEDLQRRLEEMVLPSVSIQTGGVDGAQEELPMSRHKQATLLDEERDFYSTHYPHLFKYEERNGALEHGGAGGQSALQKISSIDDFDITEATEASRSTFMHIGQMRKSVKTDADEGLPRSFKDSAFAVAMTPRFPSSAP